MYVTATHKSFCVIQQVPPGVGKMLDNCRVWTGHINDNETVLCGCAAFQWLLERLWQRSVL